MRILWNMNNWVCAIGDIETINGKRKKRCHFCWDRCGCSLAHCTIMFLSRVLPLILLFVFPFERQWISIDAVIAPSLNGQSVTILPLYVLSIYYIDFIIIGTILPKDMYLTNIRQILRIAIKYFICCSLNSLGTVILLTSL